MAVCVYVCVGEGSSIFQKFDNEFELLRYLLSVNQFEPSCSWKSVCVCMCGLSVSL